MRTRKWKEGVAAALAGVVLLSVPALAIGCLSPAVLAGSSADTGVVESQNNSDGLASSAAHEAGAVAEAATPSDWTETAFFPRRPFFVRPRLFVRPTPVFRPVFNPFVTITQSQFQSQFQFQSQSQSQSQVQVNVQTASAAISISVSVQVQVVASFSTPFFSPRLNRFF
jgi:hypothetical protein